MGNIMIADKDGNVVPVAALKMNAGLLHAGNNVWRVSAFKQVTKQIINTVTNYFTLTRDRSLTKDVVTNLETRTAMKPVSKIEATQRTRNAFEQITRTVTNIYMATRNQTRSAGASEETVTKEVSLTATVPETSVTDIVTRERTVTVYIGFGFLVTGPATVTRGNAFDLDFQSYKTTNGQLDIDYVPESIVQIDAAYSDPLDNHTPYSTDNVGWVDGKKTVEVTVDGGADSDVVTFWIHDPNTSREGFLQLPVDSAANEIAPDNILQYNGNDAASFVGVNDWDAAAVGYFSDVQINAQANFNVDSSLAGFSTYGPGFRQSRDSTDHVNMNNFVLGGYLEIPITDPQKLGLKAVRIKGDFISIIHSSETSPPSETYAWSPYAWSRYLVFSPSESPNTYPDGASMKAMSPTTSVEFTWVNQQQIASGGLPNFVDAVDIYIDIPKSWVADLVGNTLYLWCYIVKRSDIPYDTIFRSSPSNTRTATNYDQWGGRIASDIKLVLYT